MPDSTTRHRQHSRLAIIVLNQIGVPAARQLVAALPGAQLYGLASRTEGVDISFESFGDTVRQLFREGVSIVGLCATGILIRTVAPLLTDSQTEPPVIAVAADGSTVVPLLGGLTGVNALAEEIAAVLGVSAAITTTGILQFNTVLPDPPAGYRLANPEQIKVFVADLIAGASVSLVGDAPWLSASKIAFQAEGDLQIIATVKAIDPTPKQLVYHPLSVLLHIDRPTQFDTAGWIEIIRDRLIQADLAVAAVAAIVLPKTPAGAAIVSIGKELDIPIRLVAKTLALPDDCELITVGELTISIAPHPIDLATIGQPRGKLTVIGTGPGSKQWMSPEVRASILAATDLVGYQTYLDLVGELAVGKVCHASDNRVELDRSRLALDLAATGKNVVVVSSGDPGIFAMAAAVLEVLDRDAKPEWQTIDLHIAPGISAMQAAAAAIGAPLGHDFCAISLSDILKPWEIVERRIAAAAEADLAIAFYNPASSQRSWQLAAAKEILLKFRSPTTTVILARNLGRIRQRVEVITLAELTPLSADMRTVILIGSSQTRTVPRADGSSWVYTPRSYQIDSVSIDRAK
jgi:cobalt-precorrin 5A hydrolase / precorrin-3B C17-methyltransferase